MKAVAQALYQFLSDFGLHAYTADTVPEDVEAPYLVYPLTEPEWNQKASFYIQGWYRSTSNAVLTAKADEIVSAIGTGRTIQTNSGYLVLYPESPLIQFVTDGDFRSFYINLSINVYQMPGAFPENNTPG